MSSSLSFAIAGIAGRMGRQIAAAALARGHCLVGGTEPAGSEYIGGDIAHLAETQPTGLPIVSDPREAVHGGETWVDFTRPSATLTALQALDETGIKSVIIGTTGFTMAEEATLRTYANRFAIVKAGNFSFGVSLLTALTRQAAARLGPDWDIEILETHHRHKVDAPSGTALMIGEAAANGRGARLADLRRAPYEGPNSKRDVGEIAFSVRRAGGVVGDHEALFGSETEYLSLRHTALDRRVFAEGAVKAAEWAAQQAPGFYSMDDVLGV